MDFINWGIFVSTFWGIYGYLLQHVDIIYLRAFHLVIFILTIIQGIQYKQNTIIGIMEQNLMI